MSQPSPDAPEPSTEHPAPRIALRAALGGVLMGLANLVPGVSGGTMLLAAGVYEAFVSAVADVSTLRIRLRPVLVLGTIAGSAALAILLLAGPTKELVVAHRWIMYSLFIGLTLGGVPLVWRMARPVDATVVAGAVTGLIVMILMALGEGSAGSGDHGPFRLVVGGVAGATSQTSEGTKSPSDSPPNGSPANTCCCRFGRTVLYPIAVVIFHFALLEGLHEINQLRFMCFNSFWCNQRLVSFDKQEATFQGQLVGVFDVFNETKPTLWFVINT